MWRRRRVHIVFTSSPLFAVVTVVWLYAGNYEDWTKILLIRKNTIEKCSVVCSLGGSGSVGEPRSNARPAFKKHIIRAICFEAITEIRVGVCTMASYIILSRRDVVILCGGKRKYLLQAMRCGVQDLSGRLRNTRTFNIPLQTSDLIDHSTCEHIIITRNESKWLTAAVVVVRTKRYRMCINI